MPVKSALFRRWLTEMRRGKLFHAGDRVGVAVSGGQDSALLLDYMIKMGKQEGLVISVVHFNHHLRGRESDEDEEFVKQLAREKGLQFHGGAAHVAEAARLRRRNLEATARELRYKFFFRLIATSGIDKIVTAHTASDQAETVLLRLFRGSGTKGLGGIHPVLEGKIVRPFLGLMRREIEQEVERRSLDFRTDSSNRNVKFLRNRIRLQLLPLIEREYSPEAVRLLAEASARARDDEAFLQDQALEKAVPWRVREDEREKIPLRALLEFPPAIAYRVLRQMLLAVRGTLLGITHRHMEDLQRFAAEGRSGHRVSLLAGVSVRKEFNWLIIEAVSENNGSLNYSYSLNVPGEVFLPEIGAKFELKIVRSDDLGKEYNIQGQVIDRRSLGETLQLRNWRPGDSFWAAGSQKAKKLKELFREKRIPASQRRLWPVLECSGEILWVRGFSPAKTAVASAESQDTVILIERLMAPKDEARIERQKEKH